jgi:hypothetical protein
MNRVKTILWGSQRRAILATVAAVALLTVVLIWVPLVREIGAWSWVVLPVGFLVQMYRDESKQFFGHMLGRVAWLGASFDRESVRQEVEGTLAMGVGPFASSCPAGAAPRLRLSFIKTGEQVERLADGTLVVAIGRHHEHTRNLVAAAWAYARHGVIPLARPYLDTHVSQGIDFVVAKAILARADRNAVGQFLREIWVPAVHEQSELRELSRRLELLQDDCLLGPVLLTEFAEMATRLGDRFPTDAIAEETADFVNYLYALEDGQPQAHGNSNFDGRVIRCGFVLVGRPDVYAKKGPEVYRQAVEWAIKGGYRNIYLMARGNHASYVKQVAASFQADSRVRRIDEHEGEVTTSSGLVLRLIVRLALDVREYVDLGYEPRVAVGPGLEDAIRAKHDQQRRQVAPRFH